MSKVRPQIAYERHDFDKTTITIDKHGNLDETISVDDGCVVVEVIAELVELSLD